MINVDAAELMAVVEAALHLVVDLYQPFLNSRRRARRPVSSVREQLAEALAPEQHPPKARARKHFTGSKCEPSEKKREFWCQKGALVTGS